MAYVTGPVMNTGPIMGSGVDSSGAMAANAAMNSAMYGQGGGVMANGGSPGCCGMGGSGARYAGAAGAPTMVGGVPLVPAGPMASYAGAAGAPMVGGVPMASYGVGPGGANYAVSGAGYGAGPALATAGGGVAMNSMSGGTTVVPGGGGGDPCGCGPGASAGECSGACGGMETMCCEPEGTASGVQWVQSTGGAYAPVTSYQYIGEGAGTYTRQVVTTHYGWKCRKCCLALLGLLLLAGLLYLLASLFNTPEESTTVDPPPVVVPPTPAPEPVAGEKVCLIFGDPHAMTFDGQRADYYTPGEYWIVRSDTVYIQGKYQPTRMTNGLAVTKEVGVSGGFVGGHKLVISVDSITYDGAVVQKGFDNLGATWQSATKDISIVYNDQGTIMQNSRAGKKLHVVHVTLPLGVKMEVNRWMEPGEGTYINVRVIMRPQPNQDGHCGNFNGKKEDDTRTAVRARVGKDGVPANELIFPGPKTVIKSGSRPDLNDCPEGQLKIAMEKCKAAEKKFFPSNACLIDTCLGHLAPQGYR